eukprot:745962-Hanusia_phi.AAC.1
MAGLTLNFCEAGSYPDPIVMLGRDRSLQGSANTSPRGHVTSSAVSFAGHGYRYFSPSKKVVLTGGVTADSL